MQIRNLQQFAQAIKWRADELRNQNSIDGSAGGFLVPTKLAEQLLKAKHENAIVRPKSMVFDTQDENPDARLEIPVLAQGHAGLGSGVQMNWVREGDQVPESDVDFDQVRVTPSDTDSFWGRQGRQLARARNLRHNSFRSL